MGIIFIQKQAPVFQKMTTQSGMGETLGAPVHKGLKARTEANVIDFRLLAPFFKGGRR